MKASTQHEIRSGVALAALLALPLGAAFQWYYRRMAPVQKKQAEWMETCTVPQCAAVAFGAMALGVIATAVVEEQRAPSLGSVQLPPPADPVELEFVQGLKPTPEMFQTLERLRKQAVYLETTWDPGPGYYEYVGVLRGVRDDGVLLEPRTSRRCWEGGHGMLEDLPEGEPMFFRWFEIVRIQHAAHPELSVGEHARQVYPW